MKTGSRRRQIAATTFALAVLALASSDAAAQSVTGTWLLTYETPQGARTDTLVLVQAEDGTITGTAKMVMGMGARRGGGGGGGGGGGAPQGGPQARDFPVTGTLAEGKVNLTATFAMPQGDRTIEFKYTGTLTGETIEGTMERPFGARMGRRGGGGGGGGGGGQPPAPEPIPFKAVKAG